MKARELKTWRGDLTQDEAADLLGIPVASLRNYEQDRRRIPPSLARLCELLGVQEPKRRGTQIPRSNK